MPSIVPMIVITLVVSGALWGGFVWLFSGRDAWYLRLAAVALPMSAAVNLLVKRPIGQAIERAGTPPGGSEISTVALLGLFALAPVFEEAIKAVPLFAPGVRARLTDRGAATLTGFAVGVGFGMGEAAYIGWAIAQDASMQAYAWWEFTGYFGERLMVCLFHGVMTATFAVLMRRGKLWWLAGYAAAGAMHAYLNAPILLLQRGLVPEWVMSVHMLVAIVGAALLFAVLLGRKPAELTEERSPAVVYFERD